MHAILAATDLTGLSAGVLPRAAQLSKTLGAELVVAHVLTGTADGPDAALLTMTTTEALHAAWRDATGADAAPPPRFVVLHGPVETALAQTAQQAGAGLVVLGLHQPRALADALRMTTMERTVLRSPVPVLLAQDVVARDYDRVLIATAFSSACTTAARAAATIAPRAVLASVHALRLPLLHRRPGAVGVAPEALDEAAAAAETWHNGLGLGPRATRTEVFPGGVHEVLGFAIMDLKPDLIAVGRSSSARPGDLGHYARDLMRAPPTDLLVAG